MPGCNDNEKKRLKCIIAIIDNGSSLYKTKENTMSNNRVDTTKIEAYITKFWDIPHAHTNLSRN